MIVPRLIINMTSNTGNISSPKTSSSLPSSNNDFISEIQLILCHSCDLEWPGYQPPRPGVTPCFPMLIREMHRLVPYVDMDTHLINFHPFNMPHVRFRKLSIVGTVMEIDEEATYSHYQVDDGTGDVRVNYKNTYKNNEIALRNEIDGKHKKFAEFAARNKTWLETRSASKNSQTRLAVDTPFEYADEMPEEFKNYMKLRWWNETKRGMLGKKLEPLDYVQLTGHCALDFDQFKKNPCDLTKDDMRIGKHVLYATEMRALCEEEYNKMTLSTINDYARKRYQVVDEATDSLQPSSSSGTHLKAGTAKKCS